MASSSLVGTRATAATRVPAGVKGQRLQFKAEQLWAPCRFWRRGGPSCSDKQLRAPSPACFPLSVAVDANRGIVGMAHSI